MSVFNKVLNPIPENPLYIDDVEIPMDGFDYHKVTNKIVDISVTSGSGSTNIPEDGIYGTNGAAKLGSYIYANVYIPGTDVQRLNQNVPLHTDVTAVGYWLIITNYSYGTEEFSYTYEVMNGMDTVEEGTVDSIVMSYQPEKYDVSGLTVNEFYYGYTLNTYWKCQYINYNSSTNTYNFTLIRQALPSSSALGGYYLHSFNISSKVWSSTGIEVHDAHSFVSDGSYIYFLDTDSGVTSIKRFNGSSVTTLKASVSNGFLVILNNQLCLVYNSIAYTGSNFDQILTRLPNYGGIVTNSDGTYLFSTGNGVYKWNGGDSWSKLQDLLSITYSNPIVINDEIFVFSSGDLYFYNEEVGINFVYSLTDNAQIAQAVSSNKLYLLGKSANRNYMADFDISINDVRYETKLEPVGKAIAYINPVSSSVAWSQMTSPGFQPKALVVHNDKVYAFGTNQCKKWDGESWSAAPSLPYDINDTPGIVEYNGVLYLLGSGAVSANLKMFYYLDDEEGIWKRMQKKTNSYINLPYAFDTGSAVVYNNEIHLFGGGQSVSACKKHYIWNGTAWKAKSSLPFYVHYGKAFEFNNRLYVAPASYLLDVNKVGRYAYRNIYIYTPTITSKGTVKDDWLECQRLPQPTLDPYTEAMDSLIPTTSEVHYFAHTSGQYARDTLTWTPEDAQSIYSWREVSGLPNQEMGIVAIFFRGSILAMTNGNLYYQDGYHLYTIAFNEE